MTSARELELEKAALEDRIEDLEARVQELEDELQDARSHADNSDQIILNEADHYEERARDLRILAGPLEEETE